MGTTTDPDLSDGDGTRPERSGASVRVRITAAVAALTALALSGAGLIVYAIESQRIEGEIARGIDQEFAEFRSFQTQDVDPETGQPYATVDRLLIAFLQRQAPDEHEALVAWYDGAPQKKSLDRDTGTRQAFAEAAAPIVADNGAARFDNAGDELLLEAQTVQRGDETGALIVVTNRTEARAGLLDTMRTFLVVAVLSLLAITAFAAVQSGRLLAPLRTLRETAEEISDSDLSRRLPETGNDDITALTRTFNRMLDRLETAFVGQRRFLDDAGHELKTPLTVLRGHLELLDVGSPEEIAETRDLLLDEVDRMSRLVGELILLAKSDRPDFVTLRQVDLTGLTVDTLAKARGLGDREWTLDETASATVAVDEQRLTQALLQLCDNAVKHTGTGDAISVGSSHDGATVRLWVSDTGPGVPADQRQLIFERFGRGAVPEGDEGFGLGLSIVRAIAAAHGGRVRVEDVAPHGARFVIEIPATATHQPPGAPEPGPTDTQPVQVRAEEEHPLWHGS